MFNKIKFLSPIKKVAFSFLIVVALAVVVMATAYIDSGTNFLNGSHNNTQYNSTGNYVYLNWSDGTNSSYALNGTYTSDVKDFGNASYVSISWNGQVNKSCPYGNMSYIDKLGGYCIDQYEAWNNGGVAGSASGKTPWVSINRDNARTACSSAGKYLCTSKQWLGAANIQGQVYNLPATLTQCNVQGSSAALTGAFTNCVSAEGVYDIVGNVWEWVNETVDVVNPGAGNNIYYYINTTSLGWSTSASADNGKYGQDGTYFPASVSGNAVIRGGSWSDGANAGPFCANLYNAPSLTATSLGFRCCSASS